MIVCNTATSMSTLQAERVCLVLHIMVMMLVVRHEGRLSVLSVLALVACEAVEQELRLLRTSGCRQLQLGCTCLALPLTACYICQ